MVSSDVYSGVSTAKPSSAKGMAKQKAKEQEQLKTDGKCPVCRGQGRSADGQYTCKACNGTGKYTANNKRE